MPRRQRRSGSSSLLGCGVLLLACLLAPVMGTDPQDMVVVINSRPPPATPPPHKSPPPPPAGKVVVTIDDDGPKIEIVAATDPVTAPATAPDNSTANNTAAAVTDGDSPVVVMNLGKKEIVQADVIVIGAGIAGVAAGWKLKGYGNRVIILEGRNRIGGRIMTAGMQTIKGAIVELGANFLFGNQGNPVIDFAKQRNITSMEADQTTTMYDGNREVSPKEQDTFIDAYLQFRKYVRESQEIKDAPDAPLSRVLQAFVQEFGVSDRYLPGLHAMIAKEIEHKWGASLESMGYQSFDQVEVYRIAGNNNFIPGGMYQVMNSLAQGLDIRLDKIVTKVKWGGTSQAEVTTKDGRIYYARAVICTLPLGVLKAGSVQFIPPLSKNKTEAIAKLGVGLQDKIVLGFEEQFWTDTVFFDRLPPIRTGTPVVDDLGVEVVVQGEAIEVVLNTKTAAVRVGASTKPEEAPADSTNSSTSINSSISTNSTRSTSSTDGRRRLQQTDADASSKLVKTALLNVDAAQGVTVSAKDVLASSTSENSVYTHSKFMYNNFWNARWQTGANVLVLNNFGRDAWKAEYRKDVDQVADAMATLRQLYGAAVPNPKEAIITKWGLDPFAKGTVSFFPNGSQPEDMDEFNNPEENLLFAGEHTITKFHGTMHGAYLSGLITADQLQTLGLGRQYPPPSVPTAPATPNSRGFTSGSRSSSSSIPSLVNGTTLRNSAGAAAGMRPGGACGVLTVMVPLLAMALAVLLPFGML